MKITKRDIKFFFLGILAMLLIEFAYNWKGNIGVVKKGYNDGYNTSQKQ